MIDFHSHILPGMDDGAVNVEMAADMLVLSKKQGVNTIVATPHFYGNKNTISEFLSKREASYNTLVSYVSENKLDIPEIVLGAEVAFCEEILNIDLKELCIENTDAILIELPFDFWNKWVYNELYNISMKNGLNIILAHIERYVGKRNDFSRVEPFFDLDMYFQINADTFTNRKFKKVIKKLIEKGKIDIIGSDAHNMENRAPHIDRAIKIIVKKYGENTLNRIMSNAKKILNK